MNGNYTLSAETIAMLSAQIWDELPEARNQESVQVEVSSPTVQFEATIPL